MTEDEIAKNLAYNLFRMTVGFLNRQCIDEIPTYSREKLLSDMTKAIKNIMTKKG